MRKYLLAVFLVFSASCYCQDEEGLKFLLKGEVIDSETLSPIQNAEIEIINTKGIKVVLESDTNGLFEIPLEEKTSYSITVSKSNFLNARGKETTFHSKKSKIFKHKYELESIVTYHEGFIKVNLDSTCTLVKLSLKNDTIQIFKKAPILELKEPYSRLVKTSENEYKIVSDDSVRVLKIKFLDMSLVELTLDNSKQSYFIIGYSTCFSHWYELTKQN